MTFTEALKQLKNGNYVRRKGWKNTKHKICLGEPQVSVAYKSTNQYEIKIPVVVASTEQSVLITLEDIQSHDWELVEINENEFLEGLV